MLRLSTFSCIFIICKFMYNSLLVCVLISSVGCYICIPSVLQVLYMALVIVLATYLHPQGLFTHPQDNQFPLEALSQVLLPIMWPSTGPSLSSYGMPCYKALPSWKSGLTLNWQFPSSIEIIKCKTLFYYVSLSKLGYWKEILILLHLIIFKKSKFIN